MHKAEPGKIQTSLFFKHFIVSSRHSSIPWMAIDFTSSGLGYTDPSEGNIRLMKSKKKINHQRTNNFKQNTNNIHTWFSCFCSHSILDATSVQTHCSISGKLAIVNLGSDLRLLGDIFWPDVLSLASSISSNKQKPKSACETYNDYKYGQIHVIHTGNKNRSWEKT